MNDFMEIFYINVCKLINKDISIGRILDAKQLINEDICIFDFYTHNKIMRLVFDEKSVSVLTGIKIPEPPMFTTPPNTMTMPDSNGDALFFDKKDELTFHYSDPECSPEYFAKIINNF